MLIFIAFLLLLLNGLFVAAEFALVKVRHTQLDPLVKDGDSSAILTKHILRNLDTYLSASQLGITLASLGLGWIGEPTVAAMFETIFQRLNVPEQYINTISFIIAFTIISFLHIVVGEIAPKSYAIAKPLETSMALSWPMRGFYFLFYPALVLLNGTSNALLSLLGLRVNHQSLAISAKELEEMSSQSTAEGVIPQEQGKLLRNVFRFSDRVASEIMVPHNRVNFIDLDQNEQQVLERALLSGHSRFPLVDGSLDKVIGILHVKDIIPVVTQRKKSETLRKIARETIFVSEYMPAEKLLVEMQTKRTHMAIVIDEYGGTSGIVTIEDVLEELVGEIHDEFDSEIIMIQPTETGYLIDGATPLIDVFATFNMDEIESEADTVNGYLLEQLERIPTVGDIVELGGWQLKVLSLDGFRIGKLEATRILASQG